MINKITPAVRVDNGTPFDELEYGQSFIMNGGLWMKLDTDDQQAVNLSTGYVEEDLCDAMIVPVTIAITWKEAKVVEVKIGSGGKDGKK